MEGKEPTNNPLKKGKTLLLFDIDGTLTEARKVIKENMVECLKKVSSYEDIDIAIRAEKFSADAELIRTKYKGKFYSRNYQTMNAVSTYLWLMYPDKYYFYKYAVAQKVALETGLSYKPGKIAEVRKMIHQFSLMDEISAILRQDDRSRQFLNPRLDKTTYFDNQLHCMAMDFAFFIRPCYANRKE